MHSYLMQFLPDPGSVKFWGTVLLTCAVAAMPQPQKPGIYQCVYNFVQSLPIPTFAHLRMSKGDIRPVPTFPSEV